MSEKRKGFWPYFYCGWGKGKEPELDIYIPTWIYIVVLLFAVSQCQPYDTTDNKEKRQRSGMALHIDHMTGCHYVSKPLGGITPRLNKDGTQVCEP